MPAKTTKTAKPVAKPVPMDPRDDVIAAALNIAASGEWPGVTIRGLSEAASVPFGEAYAAFPSPAHVAAAVLNRGVQAAIDEMLPEASLSAKDRLFDAVMNVLDTLKDNRAALGEMLASYRWKPVIGAPVFGVLGRFARVSLDRAGIATEGAAGAARVAALSRTLWLVLGVYAEDDDGLPRTMAALDTRLREAERWAKRLGWGPAAIG
jgi:AcrR family transcriptional regulator